MLTSAKHAFLFNRTDSFGTGERKELTSALEDDLELFAFEHSGFRIVTCSGISSGKVLEFRSYVRDISPEFALLSVVCLPCI